MDWINKIRDYVDGKKVYILASADFLAQLSLLIPLLIKWIGGSMNIEDFVHQSGPYTAHAWFDLLAMAGRSALAKIQK
jgi:hypothetical protein